MFLRSKALAGIRARFLRVSGGVSGGSKEIITDLRLSPRERRCFFQDVGLDVPPCAFSA